MEDEKKQKQNYLRQVIIDGGYDAAKFTTYLENQRGSFSIYYIRNIEDGANIDVWSLDDLKQVLFYILTKNEVVNNFKRIYADDEVQKTELTQTAAGIFGASGAPAKEEGSSAPVPVSSTEYSPPAPLPAPVQAQIVASAPIPYAPPAFQKNESNVRYLIGTLVSKIGTYIDL